jgi:hypothetical protein
VKTTTSRPRLSVTSDGKGSVARAGFLLPTDLTTATGLADAFSETLANSRARRGGHDPGQVVRRPCEDRG